MSDDKLFKDLFLCVYIILDRNLELLCLLKKNTGNS